MIYLYNQEIKNYLEKIDAVKESLKAIEKEEQKIKELGFEISISVDLDLPFLESTD